MNNKGNIVCFIKSNFLVILFILITTIVVSCGSETRRTERVMHHIVESKTKEIRPLIKQHNLAYWEQATSGDIQAREKYEEVQVDFLNYFVPVNNLSSAMRFYEVQLDNLYGNKEDYHFLKKVLESGNITDTLLFREIKALTRYYLEYQLSPKLNIELQKRTSELEDKYLGMKINLWGDTINPSSAGKIMSLISDPDSLEYAYRKTAIVGDSIRSLFTKIIELRNQLAQKLGYANYYEMTLFAHDQDPVIIQKLLHKLDYVTEAPYKAILEKTISKASAKYKISRDSIMPWHLKGKAMRSGKGKMPNLDSADFLYLTKSFFEGIGFSVQPLIDRSFISFSPKKNQQFSFFMSIDYQKDGRLYVNTENSFTSLYYLFHEMAHAMHDDNVDDNVPYLLRESNMGLAEGVAMFFDGLLEKPEMLYELRLLTFEECEILKKEKVSNEQFYKINMARYKLVVLNFERELYNDPRQDLDELWWKLNERYLFQCRPSGKLPASWGNVRHLIIHPCYFQHYLIGDLISSQIDHYVLSNLSTKNGNTYVGNKKLGDFFTEKIFKYGDSKDWFTLIREATNEPLNARYYFESMCIDLDAVQKP